jgi:hypothetical protein
VTNYLLCLVGFGFSCIDIHFCELKTKVFIEIVIGLQSLIVCDI